MGCYTVGNARLYCKQRLSFSALVSKELHIFFSSLNNREYRTIIEKDEILQRFCDLSRLTRTTLVYEMTEIILFVSSFIVTNGITETTLMFISPNLNF